MKNQPPTTQSELLEHGKDLFLILLFAFVLASIAVAHYEDETAPYVSGLFATVTLGVLFWAACKAGIMLELWNKDRIHTAKHEAWYKVARDSNGEVITITNHIASLREGNNNQVGEYIQE